MFRKIRSFALPLLLLFLLAAAGEACTTILVTKGASAGRLRYGLPLGRQ